MISSPRDRLVSETFHRNPDRLADGFADVTRGRLAGRLVFSFLPQIRPLHLRKRLCDIRHFLLGKILVNRHNEVALYRGDGVGTRKLCIAVSPIRRQSHG